MSFNTHIEADAKVRLSWKEGKGPTRGRFTSEATEKMTQKSPLCLRSTHDTTHHQEQRKAHTSSLTHHHKSLCTNTLKGISLSQKEHVICTKWQWIFSTNLILHNTIAIVITYFSARGAPLNKEKDSSISVVPTGSICSEVTKLCLRTMGQRNQLPSAEGWET